MELALTVRDLEPDDLPALDWSGGSEHVRALATALEAAWADRLDLLVVALANGSPVAVGAVDYRTVEGVGTLTMLSVHELLQSLGLGSVLVRALEQRAHGRGLPRVQLSVEHDNPRAAALYRRLGYRPVGGRVESWPTSGRRTYVTVTTVLERVLGPTP